MTTSVLTSLTPSGLKWKLSLAGSAFSIDLQATDELEVYMSREIRKVPKGWLHPKGQLPYGFKYIPLLDPDYRDPKDGLYMDTPEDRFMNFDGYGPRDHYQIYETVSEGTPVSPVFESYEEMRRWLINEGYSEEAAAAFASEDGGWVPTGSYVPNKGLVMGIEQARL